ncbi:MAG: bifunctional [glutamate--ammonia ligase]-adenylyl-L-tyrosine phosphorylase/[glutamate--ammonia-ligase] adenylyltransferase [Natronospirillum sp.]|uniref:bifunctional [glutamate--ammonia ligase]-adenylyl-L-tyrosine phosphorylase/[glutamate--ammonia-ligase] adenylyltransferase n=1 Tax=Natronospirillum sp. TaxID=2812955 RepID=UPI0025D3B7F3|nr:bifunctional [glutamate--ammonia ligase]-adenylyl-L-tyrosine phosphorylase/[glutamate--ammonia-ligase] adenylyltransferase [Natronospirillum sp.]MCH8552281.1 bifunctional [glutamate--ammonia ligase]-adenylyl-L-tyrosine phosphorylase/[glutamate--ammonia-ligase] adenylyltransferase [Natronospirillum sp.]
MKQQQIFAALLEQWRALPEPVATADEHSGNLEKLVQASRFAAQVLAGDPQWMPQIAVAVGQSDHDPAQTLAEFRAESSADGEEESEADFMRALRRWRNWEQVRLIWHEVLETPPLPERLEDITRVADIAITEAVDFAMNKMMARYGETAPCPHTGRPQWMTVLGMGKLGARELNLSSDVDLVFAFPREGETRGERALSHSEFFTRVGRKIIQLLDQRTADGFVFRVDMRLRPNGQSGPLALSFPASITYYQEQGRDWERYAMIKARAITGLESADSELMPALQEFVFRRYVDYQVLSSLREMKQLIAAENRRLQRQHNIKLGAGGIREIEFIVQALQLIQGGQSPALTDANIYRVLEAIQVERLLPASVCQDLHCGYDALRRVEHLLQAQEDRQTQTLPDDDSARQSLALTAGFADWAEFLTWLDEIRDSVHQHFVAFIAPEEPEESPDHPWEPFWQNPAGADWQQDFDQHSDAVRGAVEQLQTDLERYHVSETGQARLARFMPLLLAELARLQQPVQATERVLQIVRSVLRRSAYLVMLVENPRAVRELVKLCALSPWVTEQLTDKPFLLDELTDSEQLYRLPERRALRDDLHQRLLRLPDDDLEQQMEQLRHYRHSRVLRAAACELTGNLPLMKISDYLTYTAEEVLQQVFWLAWEQMTEKYGTPTREDGSLCDTDFSLLAYGKLGGIELSYESDLDLVFVHDGAPQGTTRGVKSVDNTVFFMRLGQRIIHLLTTQTPSGILYEADMRLRPSGNSGLLVTSLSAFETYQREDAWTWEHQALVRARPVAGCPQLAERINAVRADILGLERDPESLREKVLEMREKMRANLATPVAHRAEEFHIKQDAGGIVDIEFIVQYLLLLHARAHPKLAQWSDNMRLLESLEAEGIISAEVRQELSTAYLQWRGEVHRQALQQGDGRLHGAEAIKAFNTTIESVTRCWQSILSA